LPQCGYSGTPDQLVQLRAALADPEKIAQVDLTELGD
jgi:hypothetical protein